MKYELRSFFKYVGAIQLTFGLYKEGEYKVEDKVFYITGAIQTNKFQNEDEFVDAFLEWVESNDGMFGGGVGEEGSINPLFPLEPEHQAMIREMQKAKGQEAETLAEIVEQAYARWKEYK